MVSHFGRITNGIRPHNFAKVLKVKLCLEETSFYKVSGRELDSGTVEVRLRLLVTVNIEGEIGMIQYNVRHMASSKRRYPLNGTSPLPSSTIRGISFLIFA